MGRAHCPPRSIVAFVDAGHEAVTEVQLHLGTSSCVCDNRAT